jgi:exodeoxyribonuclease VII small subunit
MEEKEKLTYDEAFSELKEIMDALQDDEIAIESLAEKVKRATFLIKHCSSKLRDTEAEISKVVKDLDL